MHIFNSSFAKKMVSKTLKHHTNVMCGHYALSEKNTPYYSACFNICLTSVLGKNDHTHVLTIK